MRTTRMTLREFKKSLKQFRKPSQEFCEHHHPNGSMLRISEGCEFIRMYAGGSWIFDTMVSFQEDQRIRSSSFQLWEFEICFDHWLVSCINAKLEVILTTKIGYARFPLDEFEIVVKNGTAFLLSEYNAQQS